MEVAAVGDGVGRNNGVLAVLRVLSVFFVLSSGLGGHKDVRPQEICCLTTLSTDVILGGGLMDDVNNPPRLHS